MFKLFKKNNGEQSAAAAELSPEQIQTALEKEAKRIHRKAVAKKVLKNTINGIASAVVGVIVYRLMEDHFGSSSEDTTITTTPTTDVSCDDYIAADAAMDYTSLEEV